MNRGTTPHDTRTSFGARWRLAAIVVAAQLTLGCAAAPSTPRPSGPPSSDANTAPSDAPSPEASGPPGSAGPDAGFFTDPPAPHDLQATLASGAAASAAIGWNGGTIEATGLDGSTYTLTIPSEALPAAVEITMTPIADLTGFGFESAPQHIAGVELEPEGLQLTLPPR